MRRSWVKQLFCGTLPVSLSEVQQGDQHDSANGDVFGLVKQFLSAAFQG